MMNGKDCVALYMLFPIILGLIDRVTGHVD